MLDIEHCVNLWSLVSDEARWRLMMIKMHQSTMVIISSCHGLLLFWCPAVTRTNAHLFSVDCYENIIQINFISRKCGLPWWCHQMETFSASLAICARNSPVTGEFPTQGPVTRSFDVFFDLRLNKHLNNQPWGWWFETPSHPLWRHCNAMWSAKCGPFCWGCQLPTNC